MPWRHREFLQSEEARRRYWARSMVGWPRFRAASPNAGHLALARWESAGRLTGIITQNVDRLHTRAGSEAVIELHGALHEVVCLQCGTLEARDELQQRLEALNPDRMQTLAALAPDGDAELPAEAVAAFEVAACRACGGVLKPNVVFFGENVRAPVVEAAFDVLRAAEVLLVVGSSLTVFSGYRFVRKAAAWGIPVGVVNLGPTRGDPLARVRVEEAAGSLLPRLTEHLLGGGGAPPRAAPTSRELAQV